jgi:hypothetical protein
MINLLRPLRLSTSDEKEDASSAIGLQSATSSGTFWAPEHGGVLGLCRSSCQAPTAKPGLSRCSDGCLSEGQDDVTGKHPLHLPRKTLLSRRWRIVVLVKRLAVPTASRLYLAHEDFTPALRPLRFGQGSGIENGHSSALTCRSRTQQTTTQRATSSRCAIVCMMTHAQWIPAVLLHPRAAIMVNSI